MTVTIVNLQRIEKATKPTDLFPPGCDVDKVFRELAKTCHPDLAMPRLRARATAAHQKLSEFKTILLNHSHAPTNFGEWFIKGPFEKGDICDLYLADRGRSKEYIIKIARSENDKDLMDRERKNLGILTSDDSKEARNFQKYLPKLVDHFTASRRPVHVFELAEGYVSLDEILSKVKLDFRHRVWMMNRLLSLLGYSHHNGIVHGAILPKHLLYHPKTHGMVLVDWCYSANLKAGEHIPAVVKGNEALYPKEVRSKRPHLATDIYMAARSLRLFCMNVPEQFHPIFQWCLAESPHSRPAKPWALQDRWIETAKKVYGEPKYIELVLPTN